MTFFQKFMEFMDLQMTTPTMFGWFHLLCLAIVIAGTVLLCVYARKFGEKAARIVVLTYSIVAILFEIYKMFNFSYNWQTNTWDFQWYAFPFQFCSTPMYIGLIAGCLKKGKVQDVLYSYLATFALFAGIAVMLYPSTVFIGTIGINIQTMICHGGMVVMGIFLYASGVVKPVFTTVLKALIVFEVLSSLALILNLSLYLPVAPETFNMFFISPYFNCELPLLQTVQNNVPYIVFLLTYLIGFFICATVVMGIVALVYKIIHFAKNRKMEKDKSLQIKDAKEKNVNVKTQKENSKDVKNQTNKSKNNKNKKKKSKNNKNKKKKSKTNKTKKK